MDEVRAGQLLEDLQVGAERLHRRVRRLQSTGHAMAGDPGAFISRLPVRAEGMDAQVHPGGEHPGELGHVDTRSAIDGGGELLGHNVDPHDSNVVQWHTGPIV